MSVPSHPAAIPPLSPAVAAAAFEHAPVPTAIVQVTDAELSIVEVNGAFAALADRPREDLVGSNPADILTGTGELRQVLSEPTGLLGADGYVVVCGDERIPVTLHVAIVQASEGMPELVLVQATELIHRRQMERALRESKQRVQDLVDNVDALIYIKSADGRFILINRHFEEVFGVRRDESSTKTNYDIVPPNVAAVYTANDLRVLEAGTPIHFEEPKSDGDSGTWLSVKFPLFDEDGRPYAVGGISTDITDRKTAETAVRQAKEEAERANRAKSDFLSRMSHELRTPLNSILGFGQLLQLEPLPPSASDSVERIVNAGRHLLALINEVLEISRIEAGGQPLRVEPVHCCGPLTEAVDLVRPLAAGRDIALEQDLHAGLFEFVLADYQRLKQVLLNILTNAVKYNRPQGTVRITLQVMPGRLLRFRFADTGRGMAPEDLERAFLPFERLDADSTDAEGTGLGLALSKGLIDAMGGAIGVEHSVKGEGSTFYVDLPLTENPHDGAGFLFASEPAAFPHRIERGGRVLYIEDNLANYDLVQKVFDRLGGLQLMSAMQGQIGIELAAEHRPDLILLDLHLPDIDGEEVLRRLRADERMRDIPVIILSADATPTQVERLKARGAEDYLTKPLELAGFVEAVERALGRAAI
jgi:PAS domain S-box-containing protein